MPQFAANLSLMYTELPLPDRFAAAARDGFRAVELHFPYAFDPRELAAQLRGQGLQLVLIHAPAGGADRADMACAWEQGARGLAAQPGREAEFRAGVSEALRYAEVLGCPRIQVLCGTVPPGVERESLKDLCVGNLRWAADQAARAGRRVLIEPINTRDMPGYFLNYQAQAHAVLAEVDSPALQVQMDLYHCQTMEGDVASKLRQYLPTGRVGHIQIAGVPERHESDTGELNYAYLLGVLDAVAAESGWDGWVGCEYRPRRGAVPHGTSDGLGWRDAIRS